MAQKSGFFNAKKVGEAYDRIYYADDFAEMMDNIVGTGVVDEDNDNLICHAQSTPNLTIYVSPGRAFINGYWYVNTVNNTLEVSPTTSTQSRIDAVALKLDLSTREISLLIEEGTSASNPEPPTPTRNDTVYEIFLAYINLPVNASAIEASYIEDKRNDETVCGKLYNQKLVAPLSDQEIDEILA